jgi:multicomponent Na+:H+ antiporter subunit A
MLFVLCAHVVAAVAAVLLARPLGRRVFWLCALAPASAFGYLVASGERAEDLHTETWRWVDDLGLNLTFRLDGFGRVMGLVVSGIGVLVFAYAARYFDRLPAGERDRRFVRFAPALTLFAGAMLGLVWSDSVLTLFICWELTSITSYALIGDKDESPAARSAALQALLTTAMGGLALLGGLVLVGQAAGTFRLSGIIAASPSGGAVNLGLVLIALGAMTKSAQVPFHGWLPKAMAAPTPVSAYLHSATMVKAGIVLLARIAPGFADEGWWTGTLVVVGVATMLVGGVRALRATDLKQVLAFGTISQLGLLVALFSVGEPVTTTAAVVLLVAHALFKAALFMVVGVVDHTLHTRDLRRMDGLARALPAVAAVAAIGAASMAGLPSMFGFVAKEKALEGLLDVERSWHLVATGAITVGSVLTVAYSARFFFGAFGRKRVFERPHDPVDTHHLHPVDPWFLAPAVVLAVPTVVLGFVPGLADHLLSTATTALGGKDLHLKVWHGFNAALGLSAIAVAGGAVLHVARRIVGALLDAGAPAVPSTQRAYESLVVATPVVGRRAAGVVQSGALRVYLGTLLITATVVPSAMLLRSWVWPDDLAWSDHPLQWLLLTVITVAALATVRATRRFAAVVLVGAVGYAMAGLFVLQGAPDLALTQVLIETLSVILFVLVLRHLPDRFRGADEQALSRTERTARVGVAVLSGAVVAVLLLVAGGTRTAPPPSEDYLARSLPDGGGRNVVNVILVDFRGLDTVGEITVLVVTALGVVGLISAGRRAKRS